MANDRDASLLIRFLFDNGPPGYEWQVRADEPDDVLYHIEGWFTNPFNAKREHVVTLAAWPASTELLRWLSCIIPRPETLVAQFQTTQAEDDRMLAALTTYANDLMQETRDWSRHEIDLITAYEHWFQAGRGLNHPVLSRRLGLEGRKRDLKDELERIGAIVS